MGSRTGRVAAIAALLLAGAACGRAPVARAPEPRQAPIDHVLHDAEPADRRIAAIGPTRFDVDAGVPAEPEAPPGAAPRLARGELRVALPQGRSVVEIEIEAGEVASIGVFGPPDGLLGFELVGAPASFGPLEEDGLLPRVVSLAAPHDDVVVLAIVDAAVPVEVARVSADALFVDAPAPRALRLGQVEPRALIGFPAPTARDDGYLIAAPGRYQFVRVDVAVALAAAFRQTRVRFRRDPIAVGDASQWDGARPASDLGRPRHISHDGGRDVDIGLPADDGEPSGIRRHCDGVLVEADVQGCAPGTVRGLDALRLAYLLGLLVEQTASTPVERILTDEVYVREVHRALRVLRERRWIKDEGFAALSEDGLLRPSPWHTDHVHVRFAGEPARRLW